MDEETLDKAIRHLRKDPVLRPYVVAAARPPFRRPKNAYQSLAHSIIYQQLSGKAAAAILARFRALFPGTRFPTPEKVLALTDEQFRSAGVSAQKASYLRDLSLRFLDGTIRPRLFPKMTDDEIREHLVVVKGIGVWTADMFLIFTLFRPDVLPTLDLGIRKGFQKVYRLASLPDDTEMERIARPWAPYRTVACWYLWRALDGDDAGW